MSQLTLDVHGQIGNCFRFKQVTLFAQLIADLQSIEPGQRWRILAGNGGSKSLSEKSVEARLIPILM